MFDMIGRVFPLKDLVENRLFCILYNSSVNFVITSKSREGNIAICVNVISLFLCLWVNPSACI